MSNIQFSILNVTMEFCHFSPFKICQGVAIPHLKIGYWTLDIHGGSHPRLNGSDS